MQQAITLSGRLCQSRQGRLRSTSGRNDGFEVRKIDSLSSQDNASSAGCRLVEWETRARKTCHVYLCSLSVGMPIVLFHLGKGAFRVRDCCDTANVSRVAKPRRSRPFIRGAHDNVRGDCPAIPSAGNFLPLELGDLWIQRVSPWHLCSGRPLSQQKGSDHDSSLRLGPLKLGPSKSSSLGSMGECTALCRMRHDNRQHFWRLGASLGPNNASILSAENSCSSSSVLPSMASISMDADA